VKVGRGKLYIGDAKGNFREVADVESFEIKPESNMTKTNAELSCIEIQVLLFHSYTAEVRDRWPDNMRSPAADEARTKFLRRGLFKMVPALPHYLLTAKGVEVVNRIKVASGAIVNRVAPAPFVTGPARVTFPPIRPRWWMDPTADLYGAPNWANLAMGTPWREDVQRWHYGIPYLAESEDTLKQGRGGGTHSFMFAVDPADLTREPYESFMQRTFRKACENVAANVRAKVRGGPWDKAPPKPQRGKFASVPRWVMRYERFKKRGAELHDAGLLTRKEWKVLFDAVFAHTDKLRDYPAANRIYRKFGLLRLATVKGFGCYLQVVYDEPKTDRRNPEEM
jgi:hypothetical protein